jgi:hypothetical protein
MTQADDLDKSVERQRLKEQKKERKRKQKMAQQEQSGPSAVLLSGESQPSNDISNVSSESDEETLRPLIKRPKSSHGKDTSLYDEITKEVATADQKTLEEMALALLQR